MSQKYLISSEIEAEHRISSIDSESEVHTNKLNSNRECETIAEEVSFLVTIHVGFHLQTQELVSP